MKQSMASSNPATFIQLILLLLLQFPSFLHSQQPYQGMGALDCKNQQNTTSLLGYSCRGRSNSCQSFLTFHCRPPYNSIPSISSLFASDPSLLSQSNSVSENATFDPDTKLIVPVNCSCSGGHFKSYSPYLIQNGDTSFTIANTTFQGLSTCQSITTENRDTTSPDLLIPGRQISVPLRCACPTTAQRRSNTTSLLTYLVSPGDSVFSITSTFIPSIPEQSILDANMLSRPNSTLYPFTTLLLPFKNTPQISNLPPITPPVNPKSSRNTFLHIIITFSTTAAIVFIAASVLILYLTLRKRKSKVSDIPKNQRKLTKLTKPSPSDIGLKQYSYRDLQTSTMNFSTECRIGGSSSSIYRAFLNGSAAAVKVTDRDVSAEIDVYKRINHFNLIRLSGVCLNDSRWYLVYDYAENGCLRRSLTRLSWMQRVQIALDVANGLNYLHTYTRPPFVHKDISSSNVLLDENFRGKVAKFGSARPVEEEEEEDMELTGTKGYMAPEYMELGIVSTKIDVYAFGVVMMEMMTGKDVEGGSPEAMDWKKEKVGGIMDPLLEDKYPIGMAVSMYVLVEKCLREDARRRPSMEEVSQALVKIQGASRSWEMKSPSKSFSSEACTPGGTEISRKVASLKSILMRKKKLRVGTGSF